MDSVVAPSPAPAPNSQTAAQERERGAQPTANSPAALAARLLIALALSMLFFAVWNPHLATAAYWTAREARVMPAFSVFVLASLIAACIQSAVPPRRFLSMAGLLCTAAALLLSGARVENSAAPPVAATTATIILPGAKEHARVKADVFEFERNGEDAQAGLAPRANPILEWLGFAASLLGAVLVGSWLGRGMTRPAHYFAFLLCATAGNAWLAQMTKESIHGAGPDGALDLVRLSWPPPGFGRVAISVLEVGVICALLESARGLRLHLLSIVLGAAAGFCGGAFLALEPWPNWTVMPALMSGMGVLIASWPDLKLTRGDALKALLCTASLLAVLSGLTLVRRQFVPDPPADTVPVRYRGTT
jgi:hypothetical protein